MKRRSFLAGIGACAAGLLTGGGWVLHKLIRRYKPLSAPQIAASIREHFHYLTFDDAVAEQFAADYLAQRGKVTGSSLTSAHLTFLMSTDFFTHDADESRELRYVAVYSPSNGCVNPLARFS